MKTYGNEDIILTPEIIPNILKWVKPNTKVLEFGPAFGYMTRYMKEYLNCDVVCVELNPDMESVLKKYAKQVIIANLDEDEWENKIHGYFDYIIFADVLEHLRNPLYVLRKAINFGDCVLTSIPNIGHAAVILGLLDGKFTYTDIGLLDNTHIHFFTRESIKEMTASCGIVPIDEKNTIRYYPSATELKTSYRKHINTAWAIARKSDSVVYQFINCWKKAGTEEPMLYKEYKLSIIKTIKTIVVDCIYNFIQEHKIENTILKKIWYKIK